MNRWHLVVLLLVLVMTGCGQAATPSPTSEGQLLARFEAELEDLRQELKIPGMSAAIVQDQDLVWAKGFGYADLENGAEATPNTPYHLASLTKPFAAIVVMQLVEEGILSLDDPISKYGVNINGPGVIRVKHLLSMTSEGNPGERYNYSGNRYFLLSQVIQEATGQSFQEHLNERILVPLNMTSTVPSDAGTAGLEGYSWDLDQVYGKLATPYALDKNYEIVKGQYPQHFSAAAGLISTVVDMAKFDAAIDQDLLVSRETKEQMWAPTISTKGAELPYGLGWHTQRYRSTKLIWHWGHWAPSVSSLILKVPDEGITFVVLANTNNLSAPFDLRQADVLRSPLALAFYKAFVLDPEGEKGVPDINWEAGVREQVRQLNRCSGESVQDLLRRELLSYTMLFPSMGRGEKLPQLLGVYAWVYLPWLFWLVAVWLALVAGSLAFLVWDMAHGTRANWAIRMTWGLTIFLFGPVGLLAYVLSYRGPQRSPSSVKLALARYSFGSTLCSVAGPTVGLLVGFVLRSAFPALETAGADKLVLTFYGLPLFVGLLALRVPLMASLLGSSYWRGLRRALPVEIISVNAVLLGLFPATVLPMIWLERLPLPHASEPYNPVFWGVLTLGAFAGALTAYLAHVSMVYCGLVPWRALAVGGGKPAPLKRIPKLRTLGAIVLTYAVLIGVIVALLPLMD